MALTRDFAATVKSRAERDPAFREALLAEVMALLRAGELATAKACGLLSGGVTGPGGVATGAAAAPSLTGPEA